MYTKRMLTIFLLCGALLIAQACLVGGGAAEEPTTAPPAGASPVQPPTESAAAQPVAPTVPSPPEPPPEPTSPSFLPADLAPVSPQNAARLVPLAAIGDTGAGVMAFSPDNLFLASGMFKSAHVKVWDLGTGAAALSYEGQTGARIISSLAWSLDAMMLASAAQGWEAADDSLAIWDSALGVELQRHRGVVGTLSPDWQVLATTEREKGKDTTLVLTALEAGQQLHTLDAASDIYMVAFSPDGSRVGAKMLSPIQDRFSFWSVESGSLDLTVYDWAGFSWSPDGRFIAAQVLTSSTSENGRLTIFDGTTFKWQRDLDEDATSIWSTAPAFSPDGRLLAASFGGELRLWDTETWQPLGSLAAGEKAAAVFSPDGRLLATSTFEGPIQLWGVEGG